jgi:hypothetical protein
MNEKKLSLKEKLINIQQELKAPKGQYNSFGKYKYRSCEDILEAVKPLLERYAVCLTISDEVTEVGSRIYVRAAATLFDAESDEHFTNVAWAREDESNKGMTGSQITGTASSYARKYCLNGLFLIDDTKDADTDEFQKQTNGSGNKISAVKVKTLKERLEKMNVDEDALCKQYGIKGLEDMDEGQLAELNGKLNKLEKGA